MRGAYHAQSENILTSLICSDDEDNRIFAVGVILQIRKGEDDGDVRVRIQKTVKINREATSLRGLINWNVDIHEPVFSCKLSIDRLKSILFTHNLVNKQCMKCPSQHKQFGQDRRGGWG